MSYKMWMEFARDNYEIVKENYDKIVYTANVYDSELDSQIEVSLTLGQTMEMCMDTSMEECLKKGVMKSVYTGYGLEKNIQKVMNEFYAL